MKNLMTPEEIEKRKAELAEDIQYVERNLLGISTLIIKEINARDVLKKGLNLYKLDGIKIDRKNNSAEVYDLETFERQVAIANENLLEEITTKNTLIKYLTNEHTRIVGVKKELEEKLSTLTNPTPAKEQSQAKTTEAVQLSFDDIKK